MNVPNQEGRPRQDVSWPMLLSIAAVLIGSLYLLHYNVVYTEGEVMQGLFTLLVCLVAGFILIHRCPTGFRIS